MSLLLFRCGVSDGSVNREDSASCLSGGLDYVETDELGLPDKEVEKVFNSSSEDVNSNPSAFFSLSGMTFSKGVKDVSRVHSGVISELFGDDLERSGESLHD